MLDTINYGKLKTKGAGGSNVCFTDGVIAIKLGNVSQHEADLMNEAAKYELSIPVFYYGVNITVPEPIMYMLKNYDRRYYYEHQEPTPVRRIKNTGHANILITPYARPLLDNSKSYTFYWMYRDHTLTDLVRARYYKTFNKEWIDDHPWNLGYYKHNLVILDF